MLRRLLCVVFLSIALLVPPVNPGDGPGVSLLPLTTLAPLPIIEGRTPCPRSPCLSEEVLSMTLVQLQRTFQHHAPGLMDVHAHYGVLVPVVRGWRGLSLPLRGPRQHPQPSAQRGVLPRWQSGAGGDAGGLRPPGDLGGAVHPRSGHLPPRPAGLPVPSHRRPAPPLPGPGEAGPAGPQPGGGAGDLSGPPGLFPHPSPLSYTYPLIPQVGDDFPNALIGFPQGYPWRAGRPRYPSTAMGTGPSGASPGASCAGWWSSWIRHKNT